MKLREVVLEERKHNYLLITKENINCYSDISSLRLKLLTEQLRNCSNLHSYEIYRELKVSQKEKLDMLHNKHNKHNKFSSIVESLLKDYIKKLDKINIENEIEKIMWLTLLYHYVDGKGLEFSTSVWQLVCVEACAIAYMFNNIIISFGCYGSRDTTDANCGIAELGIKASKFDMKIKNLKYINNQYLNQSKPKTFINHFVI